MPKVLISDKLSPRAADIFRERGIDVDVRTGMTPEELISVIGEYDGLAVRSATKATAAVLDAASNLKVIGRAGIGVDNIDVDGATQRGIVVMNTPFGNSITTAEHAIAMMFALARDLPAADASTRAGKWEKSRFMGVELTGKTLGIVGCGNIGSIVATRALGLKMKVIAFDPFLSSDRAKDLSVEKVELDELYARSDFITLHVPKTEATAGMISKEAMAKMRPTVRIINCARGGLIDEDALYEALEADRVAGVALDVFATEPARDSRFFGHERAVVTPHLGASTEEAQENVAIQVAEQMSDYLIDGAVTNALNMASVSAEEAPKLKPYLDLAEQLGSFAGQLTKTGLKGVRIIYAGDAADLNTRPLTATILTGLLRPLLATINMVNAGTIARERNISVETTQRDKVADYSTLITLEVETERGTRTLAGTLFAGTYPRVVEIRGMRIEAALSPHMLYVLNADKPGFIGALGTLLGQSNVNIGTFALGREEVGGTAIALLSVDDEVSADTLDAIRALTHVKQVEQLRF